MKAKTVLLFFLAVVLLGACNNAPSNTTNIPEGSSFFTLPASIESQSLDSSQYGIEFPKIDYFSEPMLQFEIDDKTYVDIELEYAFIQSDASISLNLTSENDEKSGKLFDLSNYLNFDTKVLFYANDSSVGPSSIWIDEIDGDPQKVFECSRPIRGLYFASNQKTFVVELASLVHYEGWLGNYYSLDFENKKFTILPYAQAATDHFCTSYYYYGKHYTIERTLTEGEYPKLMLEGESANFSLIAEDAIDVTFANKRIYYLKPAGTELYSCDLDGNDLKIVCTFDSPIRLEYIIDEFIIYRQNDAVLISNLSMTNDTERLPFTYVSSVLINNDDVKYAVNDDNLYCLSDNQVIFTNMRSKGRIIPQRIIGEWLYFYSVNEESNKYIYGKVKLDGSELTQII